MAKPKKIEGMTRENATEVRRTIEGPVREAVAGAILGASASFKPSARYDDVSNTLTLSLVVQIPAKGGKKSLSPAAADFVALAGYHPGLCAEDLGRVFEIGGKRYRITGYKSRARKRPILAEDVETSKGYVFETAIFDPKTPRARAQWVDGEVS